jgi:hypothetical protein
MLARGQGLCYREKATSLKFSQNCEFRLFQRPDEAIHRGFDKTTEMDMSRQGNFISNFQPLTRDDVKVRAVRGPDAVLMCMLHAHVL